MCLGWKFMFGCSLIYILSVCIALISALWAALIVDSSAIVLHMYNFSSFSYILFPFSFFSQIVHIHNIMMKKKGKSFLFLLKSNGDDDGI